MGRKRITPDEFFKRAAALHNNAYDYTNSVYTTMDALITVRCPQHGEFTVSGTNHIKQLSNKSLSPSGCPTCGRNKVRQRNIAGRKPFLQFVEEAIETHGTRYEYDEATYTGINNKLTIHCSIHGPFSQQGVNHLRGTGCPRCKNSHGETRIASALQALGIPYERQRTFPECVGASGGLLKFDFYLPTVDTLVEYDGEQHFHKVKFHQDMTEDTCGKMLDRTRSHDAKKTEFAVQHNIRLIRIPYFKFQEIDTIIADLIS